MDTDNDEYWELRDEEFLDELEDRADAMRMAEFEKLWEE